VLVALPSGHAEAQPRCARTAEPTVRLDFHQPKPEIGILPLAELRRMARGGLGEHEQALGLYTNELRPRLQLRFTSMTEGDHACLALREAVIEVSSAERRILLARELQRGTCRYDVTLAHERRHARIDETVLARELPKLRQAIEREARDIGAVGPVRERDLDSYREDFGERLQRVFRRELDRISEVRRREQAQIDTPEAYRREAEQCPGGLALE
jgi:hypothetical protein